MIYMNRPSSGDAHKMAEDGRLHRAKAMGADWQCRWCGGLLDTNANGKAIICPECDKPKMTND